MDIVTILVVVIFLLLFGWIVIWSVQSTRKAAQAKQQLARSLGFTLVEAEPQLEAKIVRLYRQPGVQTRYRLRNVFRKVIPDGEMFFFDLLDTSGEDDGWTERQAVAIVSPSLKLPQFSLFPKADEKYLLSGLANKIVAWGMSKMGPIVPFPEYPDFSARYIVTSGEADLVRLFLDARLVQYFAKTQMYMIHAGDDCFTFSEMDPRFNTSDQSSMTARIDRALSIMRQFQK